MKNKFKFGSRAEAFLISHPEIKNFMFLGSVWEWEQWRGGKLIDRWQQHNLMTDEGIEYIMDAALSGGTPITDFYLLLFEDDYTPTSADTYAVPGFTETEAIDEATRPAWTEAGVTSKAITNSASKATFTFNDTKTIYGGALVGGGTDPNTIADVAGGGVLVCENQFSSGSKGVISGDILKVTVTITGSDV
jgi:hypothetical protein